MQDSEEDGTLTPRMHRLRTSSGEKKQLKYLHKEDISSPDPATFRVIQHLAFDRKYGSWRARNIGPELVSRFKEATPDFGDPEEIGAVAEQLTPVCSDDYDCTPTGSNIALSVVNSSTSSDQTGDRYEVAIPRRESDQSFMSMSEKRTEHTQATLQRSSSYDDIADGVGALLKKEMYRHPHSKRCLFDSLELDDDLFKDKTKSQELYSYIKKSGGVKRSAERLQHSIKTLLTKEVEGMVADVVADRLCADWKRFARHIQLEESKIEEIDDDNDMVYEKAMQCINTWIRQSGEVVQWEKLKNVLSEISRQDIIRVVNAALVKQDQETNSPNHGSMLTEYRVDESINLDTSGDCQKILQVHPGKLIHGVSETPIAVKSFNVGNNEYLKQKLHENADLMYRLRKTAKCKNIVNIKGFHFAEDIKTFRLFTEICDFNLEQFLSDKLPDGVREKLNHVKVKITVKKVALEILNGIEFIHKNHEGSTFIHRDIKPENIMFRFQYGECVAKINDFGISKITKSGRAATMTQLNQGSDLYVAPDIKQRSESKDKQHIQITDLRMGDMFAFGITLFDMLKYGSHPFKGRSDRHTSCNILDGKRTELLKLEDKATLNLIYNLTEAIPGHRLTATEAKMHPTFFSSDQTIELIKELKSKLQDAPADLVDRFEELNRFALNKDWREQVNRELFDEFNYFGKTRKSNGNGRYRKTLSDQLKFIRNVIEHRRRNNYKNIFNQLFGKESPSIHDLILYFLNGDNHVFNGFLIHVYCTAVRVFPELDFFKDRGETHLKITDSYERYLQCSFCKSTAVGKRKNPQSSEEQVYFV